MINNFFVKTERISNKNDGLIKYINYLENEDKEKHANNEIILIHNLSRNFLNICNKNSTNLDYQNSKKGGRKVESFAQSFDFSFPPGIEVLEEDYKEFSLKIIEVLKEILPNINENEIFMNVHKNKIYNKKTESCGHLNLAVSRVSYDKELKKYTNNLDLDKKKILWKLKQEFNLFIVNKYQLDTKNYERKKYKKGTNMPLFQARLIKNEEIKEEITKNENKLNVIKENINNSNNEINILNISKNDLKEEVNHLIEDISKKTKKAKELEDLIKKSNQNANKKLTKLKEDIDNLKKEKQTLKDFEEKVNKSNFAKIIENSGVFIDIIKEKFTKHKTITKLINDYEKEITEKSKEIFKLTNNNEENKTNFIENVKRINIKNDKEKEDIKKEFEKELDKKDDYIKILYDELKKINPNNSILKKIKSK